MSIYFNTLQHRDHFTCRLKQNLITFLVFIDRFFDDLFDPLNANYDWDPREFW